MAESQNIEYKESWRDEYLKWLCGFANAQGGTIYIGIDDAGNVVGVKDVKKLIAGSVNSGILGYVIDDPENLSRRQLDLSGTVSGRMNAGDVSTGTLEYAVSDDGLIDEALDKALFGEYLMRYMGRYGDADESDIRLSCRVGTPYNIAGIHSFMMAGRFYGHLWNGYAVNGDASSASQEQIVYITENSEVYHLTTSCTHLRLSVRPVDLASVGNERNGSGGIYYPCEVCARGDAPGTVYICSSGDRYHYSGECYTLTRTYTTVPISEVADSRRPCSRCGGG